MIGYVKYFESNKTMFYTQIWKVHSNMEKKVKNLLSIKFDSGYIYIYIYDNNVNIIFHNKNVPKENVCLSLIMLDSVIKSKKKYYPQTLIEECKYEIKKTKMECFI